MENKGAYIRSIDIIELWGVYNIHWEVNPGVNVLAGVNGSGKSTILRSLGEMFAGCNVSEGLRERIADIVLTFDDGSRASFDDCHVLSHCKADIVSTFDTRLKGAEAIQKLTEDRVRTELDWEIFRIEKRYLAYLLEIGKRVIQMMGQNKSKKEIEETIAPKDRFFDLIDQLFEPTGKRIDRNSNELQFVFEGLALSPYQLSSGEKQMLLILITVLIQDGRPCILIMDEPEISLHYKWQQNLLDYIVELNPRVQLLVSTHSPAMIMKGWTDNVQEIRELML